jgi:hypothetical protein
MNRTDQQSQYVTIAEFIPREFIRDMAYRFMSILLNSIGEKSHVNLAGGFAALARALARRQVPEHTNL